MDIRDIRGIDVTNQLQSAIRAKLLELGVRYDEELPDYILVMVVNKKTRQQMHEDLHLFLEDSTTPFVEWLHDQVLKKLQKVTVGKKKTTREFVPTVVVKQEEERKKRKNIADSENQHAPSVDPKTLPIVTKEEKQQKNVEKTPPIENPPVINTPTSVSAKTDKTSRTKSISPSIEVTKSTTNIPAIQNTSEIAPEPKNVESRVKITTKRPIESEEDAEGPEKRIKSISIEPDNLNKEEADEEEDGEEEMITKDEKRLKSCVNKPKITSVVSIKNRLGIPSPRKKFETHRARDADNRYRQSDRRFEKTTFESNRFERNAFDSNRIEKNNTVEPLIRRSNFQRVKSFEDEEIASRNRNRRTPKANEGRNRSVKNFDDKLANSRIKITEKQTSTVKNRLGINRNVGGLKQPVGEDATRGSTTTIKNRLGPFRNHVSAANSYAGFVPVKNIPERSIEGNTTNMEAEDDQDDCQSVVNVGPVKSHVIALKRPEIVDGRSSKMITDAAKNVEEEEDADGSKSIASKVIVTPRPLKPLQPAQKRATQSLLLRAVAEANQSVVKQKNPEPVLSDKKPKLKRPKPPGTREIGKNLSVHLNATKRLVMEKIQVQLRTNDSEDNDKNKQYTPHPVNDEHIGVVMSLFQRSDDNQKFLVTLNGYNNNVIKEKTLSDEEEERLEMEVTEEDEIVLSNVRNDSFEEKEFSPTTTPQITEAEETEDCYKVVNYENNENHNSENVETVEEVPLRKRRKLSPIIYTRARSPNQSESTTTTPTTPTPSLSGGGKERVEQKPSIEVPLSAIVDKSREKCRYWPNCTLGIKCVYHHPAVPCGAFPACKFGDKCAYKHPKCKFGLSCTKLGCVFSHPKQQCKYHPFCTKPTCPYSHPPVHHPVVPTETIRAKFTWKRRD